MSTNQKDKPSSQRQKFLQGLKSVFSKSHDSSPAPNALSNLSLSVSGSVHTAPAPAPPSAALLTTGDYVPRTTTEGLMPLNQAPDTGDNTGVTITVEAPMDTSHSNFSPIHNVPAVTGSATLSIAGSHTTSGTTAHMTTQLEAPLTSINEGADAAISQVFSFTNNGSGTMVKDGLQMAWNGVELLLKKIEKSLTGTPLKFPVGVITTLIELKDAVSNNNQDLYDQITRTRERLTIVNEALINSKDESVEDVIQGFAGKLLEKIIEIDKLSKKATWKKILENEQDKSEIDGIFKYIDEETKDFQMRLALKIDQNIEDLHQSLDILSEAFDQVKKNHVQTRLKILHTILCAEERISTSVAAGLLHNTTNVKDIKERADDLVQKLHAVLYIKDDKVFWYHASFPDFVFAQAQSSKVSLTYGKYIVSGSYDQSVRVWDTSTGAQLQQLNGHTSWVTSVAFSLDGKCIVSGSHDMSVRVWNISIGAQLLSLYGHTQAVTSVAFSPNGKCTVSCSHDKSVRVWNTSTGAQLLELYGHNGAVTSVALSLDGKCIVSGSYDQSVRVWDTSTGVQLLELNGHTHCVTSVAFSPDGKYIVSGSYDKSVRMWNASTSAQLSGSDAHIGQVKSVAFSPDGKYLASGSDDKYIRLWNVSNSAQLHKIDGHTDSVICVTFSPDGKCIASGSEDKSVRVWDVSNGVQLWKLNGHTNWITSVVFSQDGKYIVSGSRDNSVRVWDASSGAPLQVLNGHTHWVTSVGFSPDGKCIVSGSWDNSIRVWDASSAALLQQLNGHTHWVTSVAFSSDGKCIVSGSHDRSVRIEYAMGTLMGVISPTYTLSHMGNPPASISSSPVLNILLSASSQTQPHFVWQM
ncbi:hypothetical protein E4T56_gene19548 [Termitomyces sp. T112]|nr:hypothetical protein E4T56_gene19548 [Termitomyces sp. T112]